MLTGPAVSTSHPLAASVGNNILASGGSCIDAAIALSAVLTVVEPWTSQLESDAVVLYHNAVTRQNTAFIGRSEARPANCANRRTPNQIAESEKHVATRGLISTWFASHKHQGTMPLSKLLQPAITLAEVGHIGTIGFENDARAADGRSPSPSLRGTLGNRTHGNIVAQPALAKALKQIVKQGGTDLYDGAGTARMTTLGHQTEMYPAISGRYKEFLVSTQPPPSYGAALLEALLIADGYPLYALSPVIRTHLLIECYKRSEEDCLKYLVDSLELYSPVSMLLDPHTIARRRAEIDPFFAGNQSQRVPPHPSDGACFVIVDSAGHATSWAQSNHNPFALKCAALDNAELLNCSWSGISAADYVPSCFDACTRPAIAMQTWFMSHPDGTLAYAGASPVGRLQMQTDLQVIVDLASIHPDIPRPDQSIRWETLSQKDGSTSQIRLEQTSDITLRQGLTERGHVLHTVDGQNLGYGSHIVQTVSPWPAYHKAE